MSGTKAAGWVGAATFFALAYVAAIGALIAVGVFIAFIVGAAVLFVLYMIGALRAFVEKENRPLGFDLLMMPVVMLAGGVAANLLVRAGGFDPLYEILNSGTDCAVGGENINPIEGLLRLAFGITAGLWFFFGWFIPLAIGYGHLGPKVSVKDPGRRFWVWGTAVSWGFVIGWTFSPTLTAIADYSPCP